MSATDRSGPMLSLRLTSGDSSMSAVIGLAGNWRMAVLFVNVQTSSCRHLRLTRACGPEPIARNWLAIEPATQSDSAGRYEKDTRLAKSGECVPIFLGPIALIR